MNKLLSNWGNFPRIKAEEHKFKFPKELPAYLDSHEKFAIRGLGRSYGDASLNNSILNTTYYNHLIEFNAETGELRCGAGCSLKKILEFSVPKGWFIPVSPGTKYVTAGGATAANVHGKNHHLEGCFGDHLNWFTLLLADNSVITCSKTENPEIFYATQGGMGLTGIILELSFNLKKIESAFISQRTLKAKNLEESFRNFENNENSTYSVAWIDCLAGGSQLGKSVLMLGEHASKSEVKKEQILSASGEPKLKMPFYLPAFTLNKLSIKLFNLLYYAKAGHDKTFASHYEPFFYPLDAIIDWNKMYGKPGFVQYQFVLPYEKSFDGLKEILERISKKGLGSFLAVLKLFGIEGKYLSFPKRGYTLALDFPVSTRVLMFLNELDELVMKYGGRIYLAKDARMPASFLKEMYPELDKFRKIRNSIDPDKKFSTSLSERLKI